MKHLWAALAGVTLLISVAASYAEDPPYLDFVRGLRAKGMPDLALEYLQKLGQNPPKSVAALLPLEMAKTRLDLAAAESNANQRAALQNQARAEFETFLKNNPQHPLAAEARLETAHIANLQGKALFRHAQQQDAKETIQAELLRARGQFEEAAKQLLDAVTQIDAQITALKAANTSQAESEKAVLAQARLRADLEQGMNLLSQAETYSDQADFAKRGELLKKAITLLDQAGKREPRSAAGWLAVAWLGRCHQENDDPTSARKAYSEVIAAQAESAEAAKRLARFFRMQTLSGDREDKKRLERVEQAGEEWLRLYPTALDTPEGFGVRFELANAYVTQAAGMPKSMQRSPRALELYDKAHKLYQALEQSDNEYASRAREQNLRIVLTQSQERTRGDISKLKDFPECYLRAQMEIAQLNSLTKEPSDKAEAQRGKHFANILTALNRGLDLAGRNVRADDLNDARYLRTYAFLVTGDYYSAAVAGEDLSRSHPQSTRAPLAGAYALRAYALILARQERAVSNKDELEPDRARLRSLAQYLIKTWPTDPAADIARHMLGLVFIAEKQYPEALDILERIAVASYPDAVRVLYLLADAAFRADKDGLAAPAGRPPYKQRALAALSKMPEITTAADPGTIHDYFAGKLILADLYYQDKQFEKMDVLTDALTKVLQGMDEKTRTQYQPEVGVLTLYAKLGRAEAEYGAGRYAEARKLLEPIVAQAKDPAQQAQVAAWKEKHAALLQALLGLALRASVLDNKVEEGKSLLELLQKSFPDNSQDIQIQLVRKLEEQVQRLRQQGEPAKGQLDKTIHDFSAFLDELLKQEEKSPRSDVLLFLAHAFSSLDNHTRAAELSGRIAEPKAAEGDKAPDAKQLQIYHAARMLAARELRLAKQFDRADAAIKEILATDWGKRNLEVKKERVLIVQDREHYAEAATEWNALMRTLRPRLQDNEIRKNYFDCYYNFVYSIYKNAGQSSDAQRQAKYIHTAANYIYQFEAKTKSDPVSELCKKRFQELLERELPLKEQYEQLKKALP
jgi:tetratricopeptide (TPR) repeat protein